MSIFSLPPGQLGGMSALQAQQNAYNQNAYNPMMWANQANQQSLQTAGLQQATGPSPSVIKQHVHAATLGWMSKDAACMFNDAELSEKIWDMAEALAKEGTKRGYY